MGSDLSAPQPLAQAVSMYSVYCGEWMGGEGEREGGKGKKGGGLLTGFRQFPIVGHPPLVPSGLCDAEVPVEVRVGVQSLPQGIDPVDVAVVQPKDGVKSAAPLEGSASLRERGRNKPSNVGVTLTTTISASRLEQSLLVCRFSPCVRRQQRFHGWNRGWFRASRSPKTFRFPSICCWRRR